MPLSFLLTGHHTDITITSGREKIQAHYLVLVARCKIDPEEVLEVNGHKYLERWSHLSKTVVKSFVSYLYSGTVDLNLNSLEDLESAKYFCKNYCHLEGWKLYIKSIIAENLGHQTQ